MFNLSSLWPSSVKIIVHGTKSQFKIPVLNSSKHSSIITVRSSHQKHYPVTVKLHFWSYCMVGSGKSRGLYDYMHCWKKRLIRKKSLKVSIEWSPDPLIDDLPDLKLIDCVNLENQGDQWWFCGSRALTSLLLVDWVRQS